MHTRCDRTHSLRRFPLSPKQPAAFAHGGFLSSPKIRAAAEIQLRPSRGQAMPEARLAARYLRYRRRSWEWNAVSLQYLAIAGWKLDLVFACQRIRIAVWLDAVLLVVDALVRLARLTGQSAAVYCTVRYGTFEAGLESFVVVMSDWSRCSSRPCPIL